MTARLRILLLISFVVFTISGTHAPAVDAATCDVGFWNIAHENFDPGEAYACTQWGSTHDEWVNATFSPFNATQAYLTTAGGTWEASTTFCYDCYVQFAPIPSATDKVGCRNNHTADQWVNCRHGDCFDCFGPAQGAPETKGTSDHTAIRDFRRALPMLSAILDSTTQASMTSQAVHDGLDVEKLSDVGAVRVGPHSYGALVGTDRLGTTRVAFFSGISHTNFTTVDNIIGADRLIYVHAAASRTPSGELEAGVIGVVSASIDHVRVEQADGKVLTIPLTKWNGKPFASFVVASRARATIPRVVRAYDSSGSLLSEEEEPTAPLTP
jgi:hypothetical protein